MVVDMLVYSGPGVFRARVVSLLTWPHGDRRCPAECWTVGPAGLVWTSAFRWPTGPWDLVLGSLEVVTPVVVQRVVAAWCGVVVAPTVGGCVAKDRPLCPRRTPLRMCWLGCWVPNEGCSRGRKRIHMAVGACQEFPSMVLRARSGLWCPVIPLKSPLWQSRYFC